MQPMRSFKKLIDKSHETPIVVQFYAKWCGPCKVLKPVMTRLANQADGKWVLALIDVEKHQNIAAQFNVRSIPDVHLIYKGKSIANFKGSKSSAIIEKWLANHLPRRRRKSKHHEAEAFIRHGNLEGAMREILEDVNRKSPQSEIPKLFMAMLDIGKNNPQATQLLSQVDRRGEWGGVVNALLDLIDVNTDEHDAHTPTHSPYNPTPVLANEKNRFRQFQSGLTHWIGS